MRNQFIHLITIIVLSALPMPATASDHQSPRTASLGGAGHAGPMLNDSIFLNPSYISFLPTYSVAFNYLFFKNAQSPPAPSTKGREYSIAIQDGRSELFQGGAAYTQREDGTFVHLGASKAVVKTLGFGLGAKFFFNNQRLPSGRDAMFSTTWIVDDDMQAAFVADNLFETDAGKRRDLYRELTLGLKYNLKKILLFYLDPHLAPNRPGQKYGYEAGLEIAAFSDVLFRGGLFRNSTVPWAGVRSKGFGFGAGWIAPRISFDYGLQRMQEPYTATAHTFAATVFF